MPAAIPGSWEGAPWTIKVEDSSTPNYIQEKMWVYVYITIYTCTICRHQSNYFLELKGKFWNKWNIVVHNMNIYICIYTYIYFCGSKDRTIECSFGILKRMFAVIRASFTNIFRQFYFSIALFELYKVLKTEKSAVVNPELVFVSSSYQSHACFVVSATCAMHLPSQTALDADDHGIPELWFHVTLDASEPCWVKRSNSSGSHWNEDKHWTGVLPATWPGTSRPQFFL